MKTGFPIAAPGQRIGLLGGSFDPAHEGHAHITLQALHRFGLDGVWWLISPGNPLKHHGPAPLAQRLVHARNVMDHPRVKVTDLETHLGTIVTADTVSALLATYPGVRFTWLMGADNLTQFHLWHDWRSILDRVPVGVLARPGDRISARMSPAARIYAPYRISGKASRLLGRSLAPAWCFVNVPMHNASSSAIRAQGQWS